MRDPMGQLLARNPQALPEPNPALESVKQVMLTKMAVFVTYLPIVEPVSNCETETTHQTQRFGYEIP